MMMIMIAMMSMSVIMMVIATTRIANILET